MRPASRKLSIIRSNSCTITAQVIGRYLPQLKLSAEVTASPAEEIPALLLEKPADAVILSSADFELAAEISEHFCTVVLVMAMADEIEDLRPACCLSGILCAGAEELETVLPLLAAMCMRLRSVRAQTSTLRRKLDDTRFVNRAKLLLMTRLNMSEAEAHRYIEKTAMDTGAKRREVAESIIRTYED